MKQSILCTLFCLVLMVNPLITAFAAPDSFFGPRDRRVLKSAIDGYIKHIDSIFRYGNWYGASWGSDVTETDKLGKQPPVDSLDIIAQRHAFAYQIAEQQGKIYGVAEEKRLKAMAEYLAVRDAKTLAKNPKKWQYPPADPNKASRYRDRMITGFSYEASNYGEVSITGKELNWATSPIENWQRDKSHHLNSNDLEQQVTQLQNDWAKQNLILDKQPIKPNTQQPTDNNTPATKQQPDK
jgi:hypothetical protein